MGSFIKWLIGFPWCAHKWAVQKEIKVYEDDRPNTRPVGSVFLMQCEKCGELKSKRF